MKSGSRLRWIKWSVAVVIDAVVSEPLFETARARIQPEVSDSAGAK
jgi:hypothetical protein